MSGPDDHLKAWLSAFLGGNERLRWSLTNTRSGVTRERDGEETTVEPLAEYGAVAAVTDKRVLFLVGGAGEDGRDHAASIPHEEIAGVKAVEELLTSRLVVTTGAGAIWRFTAREPADLADAAAYLDERATGDEHVRRALSEARDRREAAQAAEDGGVAVDRYDEAVAAYRRAVRLRTAPGVEADVAAERLREEVLEVVESAIETALSLARDARSRGNWELQAGHEATAHDHLATALEAFERAHELATETPPGDPERIADERDDLLRRLDRLDIRTDVSKAGTD
jgi:tetratricopeptide (TPR) repeat protein